MDGFNYKIIKIKNGDSFVDFKIFKCIRCSCDVPECEPSYIYKNEVYCWDCAFRSGLINSKEFVKHCGVLSDGVKASISPINDEIEITTSKYFSWERPSKQQRNTTEYIAWRKSVFERDKYTCQACRKIGGKLNAHHLKAFAKNKKLRTTLSNGITLCKRCHKYVHKGVIKLE